MKGSRTQQRLSQTDNIEPTLLGSSQTSEERTKLKETGRMLTFTKKPFFFFAVFCALKYTVCLYI